MIPVRLEVAEMGAIPHAELNMANIRLAAVSAPNGTGKSTFFTVAPLFALFGTTKNGCAVDDLIRHGAQEMGVTFDFEHQGRVYRVIRTRSKKGKGKSTLELQEFLDDSWVPLSGATIRETEDKIRSLLGLDADLFTASSMILQGRADEFTAKPPGQRKAVLSECLGLNVYDRLQEAAKSKARTIENALARCKERISELDARVQSLPDIEAEAAVVAVQRERLEREATVVEDQLSEAREEMRRLQACKERAGEIAQAAAALREEITSIVQEKAAQEARLERAARMLSSEAQILAKAAEYEQTRDQVMTLRAIQPQIKAYNDEASRLLKEHAQHASVLDRTVRQISEVEKDLAQKPALERQVAELRKAEGLLSVIEQLAESWKRLDDEAQAAERKAAEWDRDQERQLSQLESSMAEKRKQAALLDRVPCYETEFAGTCPLIAAAYQAKGEIEEINTRIADLNARKNPHIEGWQALIAQRDAVGYDHETHRQLRKTVETLRPAASLLAATIAKSQLLEELARTKTAAEEALADLAVRLEEVQQKAQSLAKEVAPLPDLEDRLTKLEPWVRSKDQLPVARETESSARERIATLEAQSLSCSERLAGLEAEQARLLAEAVELGQVQAQEGELQNSLQSLRTQEKSLLTRAGALAAQLESLRMDREERNRLSAEVAPQAKELVRWQTLVKAFGRDGIPALIIENAVPELEHIANEILGQMTRGENTIRFETQRDLKSRDGVVETLDIIVGDWAGERPYETFSGGEQLRIDYAIRFALSELLARRAGSKIEWLTIDEGLGSQDAEHRALVLEAIKNVAGRFRTTLVITHLEEAKGFFDDIIRMEKTQEGVEINMA